MKLTIFSDNIARFELEKLKSLISFITKMIFFFGTNNDHNLHNEYHLYESNVNYEIKSNIITLISSFFIKLVEF